jgi:hypothetical protein
MRVRVVGRVRTRNANVLAKTITATVMISPVATRCRIILANTPSTSSIYASFDPAG